MTLMAVRAEDDIYAELGLEHSFLSVNVNGTLTRFHRQLHTGAEMQSVDRPFDRTWSIRPVNL